jgi:hypothetical protein
LPDELSNNLQATQRRAGFADFHYWHARIFPRISINESGFGDHAGGNSFMEQGIQKKKGLIPQCETNHLKILNFMNRVLRNYLFHLP